MARRGENIHKRKDGRWEGRYIKARTPEGKIQWGYVYGMVYAEVKRVLIQKKAEAGFYGFIRLSTLFTYTTFSVLPSDDFLPNNVHAPIPITTTAATAAPIRIIFFFFMSASCI